MNYQDFIASKRFHTPDAGFECGTLNPKLKDFQSAISRWAIRRGKAGIFANCGLGKSFMQLVYADAVCRHTGRDVLILCPPIVKHQTKGEAERFGIENVNIAQDGSEVRPGITLTNYERIHKFDTSRFVGIVLDESSVLKSLDGATRTLLINTFSNTPYRLACTATPAPNDIDELGNHAEFLGIMSNAQMRSMFFTHDGGDTSKWRLRGHAEKKFWEWVSSWAVMIRLPSDIGFSDEGYILPKLRMVQHIIESPTASGRLFQVAAETLGDQRAARRESIQQRIDCLRGIVESFPGPRVVWCGLNDESKQCTEALREFGSIEVTGSDSPETKEERLLGFINRNHNILVSKAEVAGFGLNLQFAHLMSFLGINHSWESTYQALCRMHRFGQAEEVIADFIFSDREVGIWENLMRKMNEADRMAAGMIGAMSDFTRREIGSSTRKVTEYNPTKKMEIPAWLTS